MAKQLTSSYLTYPYIYIYIYFLHSVLLLEDYFESIGNAVLCCVLPKQDFKNHSFRFSKISKFIKIIR